MGNHIRSTHTVHLAFAPGCAAVNPPNSDIIIPRRFCHDSKVDGHSVFDCLLSNCRRCSRRPVVAFSTRVPDRPFLYIALAASSVFRSPRTPQCAMMPAGRV